MELYFYGVLDFTFEHSSLAITRVKLKQIIPLILVKKLGKTIKYSSIIYMYRRNPCIQLG